MTAQRARLALWLGTLAAIGVLAYVTRYSLIPFAAGAVVSYALAPLVDRLRYVIPLVNPRYESWRRGIAVLVIYLAFFSMLAIAALSLLPLAADQVAHFVEELPATIEGARDQTMGLLEEYRRRTSPEVQARVNALAEQGATTIAALVGRAVQQTAVTLTTTLSFLSGLAIVPFWMFYAMRDRDRVAPSLVRAAPPEVREDVRMVLTLSDLLLGRYIRAQMILGLAVGAAVSVLMALMGVDLSLGLGLWAGVTELIPILGPWIGAIPGLVLVAATNPSMLPWVALAYFTVQQLENNFLVPRIQGQALDMHPAIVILLLVVGGAAWGFMGLVVVIPVTAILREWFWYVDRRLRGHTTEEAFAESHLNGRRMKDEDVPTPVPVEPIEVVRRT